MKICGVGDVERIGGFARLFGIQAGVVCGKIWSRFTGRVGNQAEVVVQTGC